MITRYRETAPPDGDQIAFTVPQSGKYRPEFFSMAEPPCSDLLSAFERLREGPGVPVSMLFWPADHCFCFWFRRAHSLNNLPGARLAAIGSQVNPCPSQVRRVRLSNLSLQKGSANVAGTVLDVSGAAVPGAEVSLMHGDGTELHTMVSEADGEFSFTKIPPGSYLVIVDAKGFAPFTSPEFDVTVLQTYEVPNVSLSVATANIEVMVRPTDLIAAGQIKAEEKQRLIGVIPNF
jgi:hypothetical protein